jgi:hypothetical protein
MHAFDHKHRLGDRAAQTVAGVFSTESWLDPVAGNAAI